MRCREALWVNACISRTPFCHHKNIYVLAISLLAFQTNIIKPHLLKQEKCGPFIE